VRLRFFAERRDLVELVASSPDGTLAVLKDEHGDAWILRAP
jgi:hypothetical protein